MTKKMDGTKVKSFIYISWFKKLGKKRRKSLLMKKPCKVYFLSLVAKLGFPEKTIISKNLIQIKPIDLCY